MRWFFSVILLFAFNPIFSQIDIVGKVLNNENGEPLVGASVYINNSTIGSTTAADGSYRLSKVLPGTYDIVISFVSYEPIVHRVAVNEKDLRFTFRMNGKAVQMRNILVMPAELRKKRLAEMKKLFLGISLAGERSVILNEDDILFEGGEKKSQLIAFSEKPLIIVNKELGYRIHFELKEFFFDEGEGRSFFLGYSRYEEMESGNQKKWERRRLQYYLGSTMHFYHSLSDGNTYENDFRIYLSKNMGNTKVMVAASADSIVKNDPERNMKFIDVNGSMLVKYLDDPYCKSHLRNKAPFSVSVAKGVQSTLTILERPCYLDLGGQLENPLAIQYSGFWSFEKLGNMLPVDYNPPGRKPSVNRLQTKP